MNALRCVRFAARPSVLRASIPQQTRNISLLAPRRPTLALPTQAAFAPTPSVSSPALPAADALDLISKSAISAHPGLAATQIRCGPRDTYNPSHFVRKRRHGFLSRLRTKKGRKTLMRRILKGRKFLSQ